MYGLVRYDPPGPRWDDDRAITRVLFLSHLVRATEAGFEFTARITTDEAGNLLNLEPSGIAPPFARAYSTPMAQRRWLTQDESSTLRDLVSAYDTQLPHLKNTRVGLAVSVFAEAPFVFHGRPRGLLLVTALEGLVSTSPERAFKQFTTRVPALANEVGIAKCDQDWAERAYKLRSKLAHGQSVLKAVDDAERDTRLNEFETLVGETEELLRYLLRAALLDDILRGKLEDPDAHWPVPGRGCPSCRTSNSALLEVSCPKCGRSWRSG